MKTILLSVLVVIFPLVNPEPAPVHLMKDPHQIFNIPGRNESSLTVFCWKGKDPMLSSVWASGRFHLNIDNEGYKVGGRGFSVNKNLVLLTLGVLWF